MQLKYRFCLFVIVILYGAEIHSGTGFEVEKATVTSSGGSASGNNIQIKGSIGQSDASVPSTGGGFALNGGIWGKDYFNDIIFKNGFEN